MSPQGAALFTADVVGEGQAVFLRYGLMANGSIWGHGAYLGPDYSASALRRMGLVTAEAMAQAQHHKAFAALNRSEAAAVQAETAVQLKTNRYDASSSTLQFTDAQVTAFNGKRSANDSLAPLKALCWRALRDGDGGRRGVCRRGGIDGHGRLPVVRQKLREIAVLQRGQPFEHVFEIGPGIVAVEFCALDQAEDVAGTLAGLLRTHE